jgi:hypothetical protein
MFLVRCFLSLLVSVDWLLPPEALAQSAEWRRRCDEVHYRLSRLSAVLSSAVLSSGGQNRPAGGGHDPP